MKKFFLSTLLIMQVLIGFAQTLPSGISGQVVDSKSQRPMANVVVTVQNTNFTAMTNSGGKFVFDNLPVGSQLIQIRSAGFRDQILPVEVVEGRIVDLGVVVMEEDITSEQQLSLVTITESDLGDDNSGSESTAGLLQATRDAFNQAAAFNFGQARFRIRGLDNEYGRTMINGVTMNKIYDGRPQWGNWGGLNDATRNQEFTMGSGPSDYTFGGILGTQEINTRASIYRPGSRISFSSTNTNYNWRMMGTHASGMNKDGWAFVISASRRWAVEGHFEGTDYSANSVMASVEKKFNDNHSLNLTSIYAENSRGKNSPNTQEINDIAGIRYNSYWGWQDGRKRNSRDKDVEEPLTILTHYWRINDNTNLNTSIAYQLGSIGNSRLDFFKADNPDPTYYRNLPSYYTTLHTRINDIPVHTPNYEAAANANFLTERQIDWAAMYRANANNIEQGRSIYLLYEDRTDDKLFTANSNLTSQLSDKILFNSGVSYRKLRSHNFQNVLDLLGGEYFVDIDQFFIGSQQQSDLRNPNRVVREGDKYGYNYYLHADVIDAFTQFKFTYDKVDFYLAQSYSRSQYQREGLYQNGVYPTTSFGKGEKIVFENFGFKGGMTYKITGRHFFDANAAYMTKAPTMRNTFPNARLNNAITRDIQSEKISSVDASYIFRGPKLKARATAYFSKIQDATEIGFFFAEGLDLAPLPGTSSNESSPNMFVAEIVKDLDKKNMGVEVGIEYQITSTIKAIGAAAYGQYTYDNNPNVSLNIDNRREVIDYGSSSMKNYKQPGMPQQAYSLGLEYRAPKFWWIGANANYLANNYLDISSLMRTDYFFNDENNPYGLSLEGISEEDSRKYLKQEKFDPVTLVNLVGGKSWRIDGKTFGFFASINNVFDIEYKTGGFEQGRNANYSEVNQDHAGLDAGGYRSFGPKYFYGYGRTFFVNLYVNF
ncbi:MAG: carboxypeptidase regulatory-like domain-containing protein [Flavobacterium sp.]|nr:carboxypeptidase regulatory-like domain-containing protein [Flavobacterium sp.]